MRTNQLFMTRALLAVLLTAALAACGGGGSGDDQVATLADDDTTDDASEGDGGDGDELTEGEREDAMLEFSECMREHGVDLPDPGSGDRGERVIVGGPGEGPDAEAFEEANEACEDLLEDAFGERPPMSPEEEAEMQDNALAFAECMRENGIDMPDPEFGDGPGGGFSIALGEPGEGGRIDPEDPDFEAAQEACQGELGFEEDDGPGGRVGGGPSVQVNRS